MQQKMKTKPYFQDRDFIFDDSLKIDSLRLISELCPPNEENNQSLLLNLIIATQAKNEQAKTLKAFFKELPKFCAIHIKELQRRKGAKISHEDQKRLEQLIRYIFIKETVIFFSFIGCNTTQFLRNKGLYYANSNQMYINCQKVNDRAKESQSKQETHQLNSKQYNGTKMQVSFLIKQGRQTKQTQMRSQHLSKSQAQGQKITEAQGQLIHDYFKQIIREEDRLSILKGHSNTFYIIDQRAILGKGGFGEVCQGQSIKWIKGGTIQTQTWAIKSCKKNINQYKECGYSISQEREHQILMQINKMTKKEQHKAGNYIIGIKEVINQKNKKYIVYEYCPHNSLREITKKRRVLSLKNIYEIALQLAQVLQLIHLDLIKTQADFLNFSVHFQGDLELNQDIKNFKNLQNLQNQPMGIIHRDLKLNNILVKQISQEHIVIKVIDWAFCKRTYTNLKINKVHCGTVHYQAPQIQAKEKYNSKVDIWAFGAVIFQLLTERQFFDKNSGNNTKKEFKNVIKNMQFMECYKQMLEQENQFWRGMLLGTLNNEVDSRWSALQLCNHILSYKRYRSMEEQDFKELAKLTSAKDCLLQHLGALLPKAKRSRLTSLAFAEFARLLVGSTDFLMVKLFKDKINLQSYHLSLLYSLKPQKIYKIEEIPYKLQQSISFFMAFAGQYPRLSELVLCIQYLVKRYKAQGINKSE